MRRMIDPQVIIKSQVVDDKWAVDLNEILEKYGTTFDDNKTITLQIYNKTATDEGLNQLIVDSGGIGQVGINGVITITKNENSDIYIQGMMFNTSMVFVTYFEISDGSYENGLMLKTSSEFDIYVIKV